MFKQYKLKNYRFRLVAYVVLLCIIGVMVVGSAKPSVQNKQIIGIAGGLVVMVIVSLIDYGTILKFRRPIYLLAVVLLAVIFIPGVGDNTGGATRWIQVTSSFKFQPSEFCKILLIIFFAGFLMKIIVVAMVVDRSGSFTINASGIPARIRLSNIVFQVFN